VFGFLKFKKNVDVPNDLDDSKLDSSDKEFYDINLIEDAKDEDKEDAKETNDEESVDEEKKDEVLESGDDIVKETSSIEDFLKKEDIEKDDSSATDNESEDDEPLDTSSDSDKDNTSDAKSQVSPYHDQIVWAITFAVVILLFLSNFHLSGVFGNILNNFLFGMFGLPAYISPIMLLCVVYVYLNNKQSVFGVRKVVSSIFFFVTLCSMLQLAIFDNTMGIINYFKNSANEKTGGGLLGGLCCKLLYNLFGKWGSLVVLIIVSLILLIIITEKNIISIFGSMLKNTGTKLKDRATHNDYDKDEVEIDLEKLDSAVNDSNDNKSKKKFITFNISSDSFDDEMSENEDEEVIKDDNEDEVNKDESKDENDKIDSSKETQEDIVDKNLGISTTNEPLYSDNEDICDKELNNKFNKVNDIRNLADCLFEGKDDIDEQLSHFEKDDDIEVIDKNESDSVSLNEDEAKNDETLSKENIEDADFTELKDEADKADEVDNADNLKIASSEPIQELVLDDKKVDEGEQVEFSSSLYHQEDEKRDDEITTKDIVDALESVENALNNGSFNESSASLNENIVSSDTSENADNKDNTVSSEDTNKTASQGDTAKKVKKKRASKKYKFPDINFLQEAKNDTSDTKKECEAVAEKLVSTLESFGVNVTLTDISYGPIVTRYEIQPAQGVKVSKITSLTDDIKLNLAAEQIRIEAPIPGKAAIGIEVPNKGETKIVSFRELIESKEFKKSKSDISFAVGKDISGKVVIADIAKMPHLLIAGQTGAGKSVCINTLIMSILYKANPDDVKLIMIDPKVVELSIYNGIPHLLIPVVTDPKKAYGALNWAVTEMVSRYQRFADLHVRDISSYNEKVSKKAEISGTLDEEHKKMQQIVIIVDELSDLMMACPDKVEDAICRLAQMARAAGIHLIIATQRPSVNVITGLIKANIPSRIAFSVASAVDSRTIIDGGGAEKLLGRGDMLFFPTGYPKPVRVQGAYISDKEVTDVVEYLISQNIEDKESAMDIENEIEENTKLQENEGVKSKKENDEYFEDAARFVIEKEKASIGMLQRFYKIGFNRAARIMDQLYEAGVVGEEEGTKPRSVRMTLDDFEKYKESSKVE